MEVLKERYEWANDALSRLAESLVKIEREKSGPDYEDLKTFFFKDLEFVWIKSGSF